MIIDAHQHYWRLDRGDYGWLTADLPAVYRDFGPSDLVPHLDAHGIDATVLVQAAPTEAETHYILALAAQHPRIAAVVGWVDFDRADVVGRIEALANDPKLVGLRPMLQDIADTDWIMQPQNMAPLTAMTRLGLRFDALIQPRHLGVMLDLVQKVPDLAIVIDHAAKPVIVSGDMADWARGMRRLAADTRAMCKLSGLVTEAAPGWTAETLKPYVDVLMEAFGPTRLMWGSDWPVLNLNGDYDAWWQAAQSLISGLRLEDQALIMGGNAQAFYGLPR